MIQTKNANPLRLNRGWMRRTDRLTNFTNTNTNTNTKNNNNY